MENLLFQIAELCLFDTFFSGITSIFLVWEKKCNKIDNNTYDLKKKGEGQVCGPLNTPNSSLYYYKLMQILEISVFTFSICLPFYV